MKFCHFFYSKPITMARTGVFVIFLLHLTGEVAKGMTTVSQTIMN